MNCTIYGNVTMVILRPKIWKSCRMVASLLYVQRSQCGIGTTGNLAHMKLWFFYVNMRVTKTKMIVFFTTASKLLLQQLWRRFFYVQYLVLLFIVLKFIHYELWGFFSHFARILAQELDSSLIPFSSTIWRLRIWSPQKDIFT